MKAKKNIAQQVMLYIILAVIIVVALVYFLVYRSFEDKASKLKSQNSTLQARVTVLKGYYDEMDSNQKLIDSMNEQIANMLDEFDADAIREEDVIMQAVKSLGVSDTEYTNINIVSPEAFKMIDGSVVRGAGIEGLESDIIFAKRNASYVAICDYPNLKQCLAEYNARPSRSTITNINFTNEDNELKGTIEYDFYYVIGTPKEYVPLDMKEYTAGLEDLFKLKKLDEETEEEAEAEEAE